MTLPTAVLPLAGLYAARREPNCDGRRNIQALRSQQQDRYGASRAMLKARSGPQTIIANENRLETLIDPLIGPSGQASY